MLYEDYLSKTHAALNNRAQRISALQTEEDAKRYQADVRRKLARSFGPLPERTPLNSRVTGTIELGDLLIDKILFESRPGFYVSALFYRKKTISQPLPAILFLCGHSLTGKFQSFYQEAPQHFAHRGFAVLSVDPYGQGERREFPDDETFGATTGHNLRGKQLLLAGEFFGTWRLWDAIRSLDYLLTREEVDATRVGATGTSGGGTMTAFLNAFESRLTMAAPSCYITSLRNNLSNELSADAEQNPPIFLKQELDHADLIIASAPRPVMILAQDNDFFDLRGTQQAYADCLHIYSLLNAPDNIHLHIGHGDHGYAPNHRIAAAQFFGYTGKGPEPKLEILPDETLYCAPEGSVFNIPGSRTINDFIKEKTIKPPFVDTDQIERPHFDILRSKLLQENPILFANRFRLGKSILKVVSKQRFFSPPPVEKAIVSLNGFDGTLPENEMLFLLDVRGQGECAETLEGINSEDLYARYANMFGEPYLTEKVKDVIGACLLLRQWGATHITLKAEHEMTVLANYAAPWADAIELNNTLPTFDQLAKETKSTYPEWLFPFSQP